MYGSRAEADAYFTNELSGELTNELTGTWTNYTNSQKTQALENASKAINRMQFRGQDNISTGERQVPVDVEIATYKRFFSFLHQRGKKCMEV